jgi:hypothetical protein
MPVTSSISAGETEVGLSATSAVFWLVEPGGTAIEMTDFSGATASRCQRGWI